MPPGANCAKKTKSGTCGRKNGTSVQCSAVRASDNAPCTNWVHSQKGCSGIGAGDFQKQTFRWRCDMAEGNISHKFDVNAAKGGAAGSPKTSKGERSSSSSSSMSSLTTVGTAPSTPMEVTWLRSCFSPECSHPGVGLMSAGDTDFDGQLEGMRCQVKVRGLQCVHWAHRACASLSEDEDANKRFRSMTRYDCRRDAFVRHDYGTESTRDVFARTHNDKVRRASLQTFGPPSPAWSDDGGSYTSDEIGSEAD